MISLGFVCSRVCIGERSSSNTFFIIVKQMWEHSVGLLTEAQFLCNLAHIPWNIRVKLPTWPKVFCWFLKSLLTTPCLKLALVFARNQEWSTIVLIERVAVCCRTHLFLLVTDPIYKSGLRTAGDPQGHGCRPDVPKAQLDDFLTNIGLTLGRRLTYTPRRRVLGSIPSRCSICVVQLWPFTIAVFEVRLCFCRNYQFKQLAVLHCHCAPVY